MLPTVNTDALKPVEARLARLDDNVLTITDRSPSNGVRMTVVRLVDGQLVLFGAVELEPEEERALKRFGAPAYLVVPSESYGEDAKRLKERFPELLVIASAGVREQLQAKLLVNQTSVAFEDPAVCFVTVPGTRDTETALLVETAGGVTLVVDELLSNFDEQGRIGPWRLRFDHAAQRQSLLPASPFFQSANEREILRAQLLAWSQLDRLNRIIVSRGAVITESVSHTLVEVAATLAA